MNVKDYTRYFEAEFGWTESITTGKIDRNKEKAVCFYNSQRTAAKINAVGGIANRGYSLKSITILLRYTKNADDAETMANKIQDFFSEMSFFIGKKRVFALMIFDAPINLGTDDSGVYEYSFEIDFIENKEV